MADLVVEARGLRKSYRDRGRPLVAVDDLDLAVPRGAVHGFLGPNGSGKTTTIKLLLGLSRADAGSVRLLGHPMPAERAAALRKVGAVVEEPRFAPDLTARRSLQLLAGLAGIGEERVDAVLEQVDLASRARNRVATYSLGMRHRLGIAAALLKEPELLVLDEPSNGLDPAGIVDMRELIRRLSGSGTTVLLSSHILAEVQQLCTSVTIIGEGAVLATGEVDSLLGEGTAQTRIEIADATAAAGVLTEAGYAVRESRGALLVEGHEHPEEISRALAARDLYPSGISAVRPDLEDFFMKLTGHRPDAAEDPAQRIADETAERLILDGVDIDGGDPGGDPGDDPGDDAGAAR